MLGYNFTERVRRVLAMAREEAVFLHHEYVGTEHILLGLVREGEGVAAAVLDNMKVDADAVRRQVVELVKKGTQQRGSDLPYTTRAKKVLEFAMAEARELHHEYIGTEHLLLGLLREEKGVGAQVLTHLGADVASVRREVQRLLGASTPSASSRVSHSEGRTMRPIAFEIRVDCENGYWYKERFDRVADGIAFLESLPRPAAPPGL
jgi:ATP-dependent Clp protease ATP-binding subunit ClpC